LVVSGISYDEDRVVEYSEPYYKSAQVLLVTEDSDVKASKDLDGKIVAKNFFRFHTLVILSKKNIIFFQTFDFL
ncbi:hypothetical protein, partial [Acinetobacter baumannii]|uniref:hypothetical protein n=1 Tax=Acinetobacter baumannii TaxID=470 RepID=UPI0031F4495C